MPVLAVKIPCSKEPLTHTLSYRRWNLSQRYFNVSIPMFILSKKGREIDCDYCRLSSQRLEVQTAVLPLIFLSWGLWHDLVILCF